jgi:hypothetical protein
VANDRSTPAMKRILLISATALLIMLGVGGVAFLFLTSLNPSERAYAAIPHIRLPVLGPEQFAYIKDPTALDNWPSVLLIVRRRDASLGVWRIPTRDGNVQLPDIHWWRQGQTCPRFEPDFRSGVIGCVGGDLGEWGRHAYRWDLEGRNIGGQVDDMPAVRGREEGGEYVLTPNRSARTAGAPFLRAPD